MTTTATSATNGNASSAQRNYTRDDLEAVNIERALTLLPVMLFLGILMSVGILGNSLVCYIFCCRLKSGTQNFLIVCLAVFDLISSMVSIPNEIADVRLYFESMPASACKIMRFITMFCAQSSILTLLMIAIDRYRKICKPLLGQLHMKHVRISLIPIIGGAILLSWPVLIMYGLRTAETAIPGLFTQDCSTTDDFSNTIYPLLYMFLLFLNFIIFTTTLIIIYTLVLRETKRHRFIKHNPDNESESSNKSYSKDSGTSATAVYLTDSSLPAHQTASPHSSGTSTTNVSFTPSASQSPQSATQHATNSPNLVKHSRLPPATDNRRTDLRTIVLNDNVSTTNQRSIGRRKRVKSKTTMIAFLVTLVFILSFLPHLSIRVAWVIYPGFEHNLQGASLIAYHIFIRSYFINSVSNPIIYGVLNVHFSNEVKFVARKLCRK